MANDRVSATLRALLARACGLSAVLFALQARKLSDGAWLRVEPAAPVPGLPALSVVVPARDEEDTILRCVRSLLAQTLDVEVIVVDDGSRDATPALLAALAPSEPRLRVVPGAALPDAWVGKPWACAQGAAAASGAWLLFTDADTFHEPAACASALRFALERGADALTLATYQELGSWGERAVLPTMLGLILLASGSMRQLNDPYDAAHAAANGQYLLVRRAAYEALGGHGALRAEIVEDLSFARRLKADGRYRLLVASGELLVRVRMYRSLRALWAGFTKNVYAGANGDLRALLGASVLLTCVSVVPAALLAGAVLRRRPAHAIEPLLALGAGIALQAYGLSRGALPIRLAWWAPVGYAACAGMTMTSTLAVVTGRGVRWRGRRYSGRGGSA